MPDRFQLLERIGRGGMGVVWRARDSATGEIVAVKLLHEMYADDPEYVARFEREVEVARRINSANVVRGLGFGRRDGVPYMVMEYVEGESLDRLLKRRGPLPWPEVRALAMQVANGLAAAHANGVLHRDIKPSNILITRDGTPRLADFGIARAADLSRLTGSATMLGTPPYMAPEGQEDARSDLYSLGVVLFEALAGRKPFLGESPQQLLRQHLYDAPDLRLLPPESRAYVGWLLQKQPAARPPSATAFVAALTGNTAPRITRVRTPWEHSRRSLAPIAIGAGVGLLSIGAAVGVVLAVVGVSGGESKTVAAPTAVLTTRAQEQPATAAPTATATWTPTRTAAARSATSAVSLSVGARVIVVNAPNTADGGLMTRASPGKAATPLNKVYTGTTGVIIDGPQLVTDEGIEHRWWKIRWDSGLKDAWSADGEQGTPWLIPGPPQ